MERWTCRPVARCVATCTFENVPAPITFDKVHQDYSRYADHSLCGQGFAPEAKLCTRSKRMLAGDALRASGLEVMVWGLGGLVQGLELMGWGIVAGVADGRASTLWFGVLGFGFENWC